jgi:hypothetical protein
MSSCRTLSSGGRLDKSGPASAYVWEVLVTPQVAVRARSGVSFGIFVALGILDWNHVLEGMGTQDMLRWVFHRIPNLVGRRKVQLRLV